MSKKHGAKGPAYRAGEKARKDEENAKFGVGRNHRPYIGGPTHWRPR